MFPTSDVNRTVLATRLRLALLDNAAESRRVVRHSHELDYGRHGGPPPYDARAAAVLVLLVDRDRQWQIPLIVRPADASTHAGQTSFPGGRMERDETAEACACREAAEELGLDAGEFDLIGRLAPIYIYASNHSMTPCLAVARAIPELRPNPDEVASVIWLPVDVLFDPQYRGTHEIVRWGAAFLTPHIHWAGQRIWGATRIVLDEVAALWRAADCETIRPSSTQPEPRCTECQHKELPP